MQARSGNKNWNSFDRLVGIKERDEFVAYALQQAGDQEFRQLLAPEIMAAYAYTADIYCIPQYNFLQKQASCDHYRLFDNKNLLLPPKMKFELEQMIVDYFQKERIKPGEKTENLPYLQDLLLFFECADHKIEHKQSYAILQEAIKAIFSSQNYLDERIYKEYVQAYGEKYQRGFKLGARSSASMIDIAARYLNTQIVIQEEKDEVLIDRYRTEARPEYGNQVKRIKCAGFDHFMSRFESVNSSTKTILGCTAISSERLEDRLVGSESAADFLLSRKRASSYGALRCDGNSSDSDSEEIGNSKTRDNGEAATCLFM